MQLRVLSVVTILISALFAASCFPTGPKRLCRESFEAGCRQAEECDRTAFDLLFTSVDDCVASFERFVDCSEITKEDVCTDPKDYDGRKATACLRAIRGRECGDAAQPDVCGEVCN